MTLRVARPVWMKPEICTTSRYRSLFAAYHGGYYLTNVELENAGQWGQVSSDDAMFAVNAHKLTSESSIRYVKESLFQAKHSLRAVVPLICQL